MHLGYDAIMGVLIYFWNKFNPDQFEILELVNSAGCVDYECPTIIGYGGNKRKRYNHLIIKKKHNTIKEVKK